MQNYAETAGSTRRIQLASQEMKLWFLPHTVSAKKYPLFNHKENIVVSGRSSWEGCTFPPGYRRQNSSQCVTVTTHKTPSAEPFSIQSKHFHRSFPNAAVFEMVIPHPFNQEVQILHCPLSLFMGKEVSNWGKSSLSGSPSFTSACLQRFLSSSPQNTHRAHLLRVPTLELVHLCILSWGR